MRSRLVVVMLLVTASFAAVAGAEPRDDVRAAITKLRNQQPGFAYHTRVKDWVDQSRIMRDEFSGRCRPDGIGEVEVRYPAERVYLISYFNKQGNFVTNLDGGGAWKTLKDLAGDAAKAPPDSKLAIIMTVPALAWSWDEVGATLDGARDVRIDGADHDVLIADLTKEQIAKLMGKQVPNSWEPGAPPAVAKAVSGDHGIVRYTIHDGVPAKMQIILMGTIQISPGKTGMLERRIETEFFPIEAFKLQYSENAMALLGK